MLWTLGVARGGAARVGSHTARPSAPPACAEIAARGQCPMPPTTREAAARDQRASTCSHAHRASRVPRGK
eukprot:scaffold19918_cov75-Phaeocystis_antarctica.AAC.2